jgi:RNA polymerase primary sigma factor
MLLSYLNKRVVSNSDLALQLENAKGDLVQSFIAFPMTAVWLVDKYHASHCAEQQLAIALGEKLKNLKKHDLIVNPALGDNDRFAENNEEKRGFIEMFRAFPFSFEDLIELTDVVVYSYQISGLVEQIIDFSLKKPAGWLLKRLRNLTRLNSAALVALQEHLSSNELPSYQAVIDTVVAEHGWLQARQQLVERNAKLVSFIANQYKGGFLDFDDLVQEGQTGLLVAVDKFDHRFDCQFSTYAAYWIRQRILRALSQNERVVRLPSDQISAINKLYRLKEQWLAKTGLEPSVAELAAYTNKSVHETDTLLSLSQTAVSLENFDDEDEVTAPIDVLEQQIFEPCFDQMAQTELENWLESAINTLNAREAKVIRSHFGLDSDHEMTLQEIGTELNISRERVRQIQITAFDKMKLNYGEQLVSFL